MGNELDVIIALFFAYEACKSSNVVVMFLKYFNLHNCCLEVGVLTSIRLRERHSSTSEEVRVHKYNLRYEAQIRQVHYTLMLHKAVYIVEWSDTSCYIQGLAPSETWRPS